MRKIRINTPPRISIFPAVIDGGLRDIKVVRQSKWCRFLNVPFFVFGNRIFFKDEMNLADYRKGLKLIEKWFRLIVI